MNLGAGGFGSVEGKAAFADPKLAEGTLIPTIRVRKMRPIETGLCETEDTAALRTIKSMVKRDLVVKREAGRLLIFWKRRRVVWGSGAEKVSPNCSTSVVD